MEMERDPQRIGSAVFPLELKQLYVAALWFRNRGGNSSIPTTLTVERRGSVDCVLVKKTRSVEKQQLLFAVTAAVVPHIDK